jgi:hypothetical protein
MWLRALPGGAHCDWMAAGPRERVHRTMSRSRSLSGQPYGWGWKYWARMPLRYGVVPIARLPAYG